MLNEEVERIARRLHPAAQRLTMRLGSRWIKGTGIVHRSVGTELIELGVAEVRSHHNERQIRALPFGLAVRNFLLNQETKS